MERETSPRAAPARLRGGSSAAFDGVHFPTLFAHLMKLGQDEASANAADAAAAAKADSKNASLPKSGSAATPSEKNAMFEKDSADVRAWMRHAREHELADSVVVSSATTLAVRFLQRRYRYPALSCAQSTGANNGTKSGTVQQRRGRGNRRRRCASAGVLSELLANTCLHLASKYHCVEDLDTETFGSPLNMSKIFSLGYDISLSMGAALNASFRANASTLQSLFCDLADEPAVVRACSEWFALCLVLLLDPSREEMHLTPPSSQQRGQHLFSPASSASTAPVTPASSAASTTTTATPASTTMLPTTPASSSSSSSGSSGTSSSSSGALPHRDQFSRATVLGLGSLVLARRLARARGPCLPIQVQEVLGLRNDDALDLVTEGVCLARKAFETQTPPDGKEEKEEEEHGSSNKGKGLLAGVAVFERDVVSLSGTTRTLLEWVTADREEEDGAQAVARAPLDDCLEKAGAPRKRKCFPDFVQGALLFPSGGRSRSPSRSHTRARSLGSGSVSGSGGGLSSAAGGSDTNSDMSKKSGVATGERESLFLSSGGECSMGVAGKGRSSPSSSPSPPSSFVAANMEATTLPPPTRTLGNDVDDAMESGGTTPSSATSSSDRVACAGHSARSGSGGVLAASRLDCGNTASCDDGPPTRKRVASEHADGEQPSREGGGAGNKRPRRTAGETTTTAAPLSSEQQKNARWEVLINRILAALDDHCGCSFCKLRDGSDHGGGAVRDGGAKHVPIPPLPSLPRPLHNPPREPPNNAVDGQCPTAPAPSLPPYPSFTPPGPPPAAPLGDSPSLHGSPPGGVGAPPSRPRPVEEVHGDGRRSVAGLLEQMDGDGETPTAEEEEGDRGSKRPEVVAAGRAGYGAPLLKLCTAAMASLAASSAGAAISEDTNSAEGGQSWWW